MACHKKLSSESNASRSKSMQFILCISRDSFMIPLLNKGDALLLNFNQLGILDWQVPEIDCHTFPGKSIYVVGSCNLIGHPNI